jgi:hypothetical protein
MNSGIPVWLLVVYAVAVSPVVSSEESLVYWAAHDRVAQLSPRVLRKTTKAAPLPEELVIATGDYTFKGSAYRLEREGLYRFIQYGGDVQQRIVFGSDVEAFLSAISWATVHGLRDNSSVTDWKNQLKFRKVAVTCWSVSLLAKKLLAERGIKARIVSVFTQEKSNNFSDGHAIIETYRKDLGKWVAYDIDNNVIPTDAGERLSVLEIFDLIRIKKPIDFKILSSDPLYDASDLNFAGFDASFVYDKMASSARSIRDFYDRVFGAVAIFDENQKGAVIFAEEIHPVFREYILNQNSTYTWVSRQAFTERLYGFPDG